jgi:hypothetical protein
MTFIDKKWCGHKCGNSNTNADTGGPWYKNEVINCPADYEWWTRGKRHPVFGYQGGDGWNRGANGSVWVKECVRIIKGDKLQCALGMFEDKHCENGFGKNKPQSNLFMNLSCSGDNIVNKGFCSREWKNVNPAEYNNKLGSFCGNSVNNINKYPECKKYCFDNPGKCPAVHNNSGGYCSLFKDDPLCGCVNSPLNDSAGRTDGQAPATCFDNVCTSQGYKTSPNYIGGGIGSACPTFMKCSQNINITDQAYLERVNISQSCKVERAAADKKEADKAALGATLLAEKHRDSVLAATLAKEAVFNSEKTTKVFNSEKRKYIADTPAWKLQYDSAISSGILKEVAEGVNSIVPNTKITLGGVEIDEIKPLILLFIIIIILLYSRSKPGVNTRVGSTPVDYNTPYDAPYSNYNNQYNNYRQ